MIPRRTFIVTATGLLMTARAAHAQQTAHTAGLGMLLTGTPSNPRQPPEVAVFMEEFCQLGWVEGQNLLVERRWTERPDCCEGFEPQHLDHALLL